MGEVIQLPNLKQAPERLPLGWWAPQIYIIGSDRAGPLKIGISRDPYVRLRELQSGNPNLLQVFATFYVEPE